MGAAPTRDQGHNLVENVKASGGLPATKLVHPQGSEALIYHHGATVTSFKTANKTEGIFFLEFLHAINSYIYLTLYPIRPNSYFRVF